MPSPIPGLDMINLQADRSPSGDVQRIAGYYPSKINIVKMNQKVWKIHSVLLHFVRWYLQSQLFSWCEVGEAYLKGIANTNCSAQRILKLGRSIATILDFLQANMIFDGGASYKCINTCAMFFVLLWDNGRKALNFGSAMEQHTISLDFKMYHRTLFWLKTIDCLILLPMLIHAFIYWFWTEAAIIVHSSLFWKDHFALVNDIIRSHAIRGSLIWP